MSKPDLRAGLEADLKLVCDGRKTKEEVRLFLRLRNVLNNFYPILSKEVYKSFPSELA